MLLSLMGGAAFAQNGLESVIVEQYYVSDAADAAGSIGTLPVGSVTYRVYADLLPGYKFQALYGVPGHTLNINSTTPFFNNEDRGNTNPAIGAAFINDNSVGLDSWFSVGGAANGNLGVQKSEDNGAANILSGCPILQNADPYAGIDLMTQDGMQTGTPVAVTFVGLTAPQLEVFNATSLFGSSFTTSNGSIAALGGSVGVTPATNKVLIGQFTTDGTFHFELNIQIGTPTSGTQNFVAFSPVGAEISIPSLVFSSTPIAPTTANPTYTYCVGATATALTAITSPSCTLLWYTVPTGGTGSATAPTPSTASAGTTTYYVSQINGAGNEGTRIPITVTVNPLPTTPTISAGGPITFCSGGNVVLTSSASSGNTWSTTATTNAITVSSSGSYTVTETDVNGCQATSVATAVTVNPLPSTPTISASGPLTFCSGGSVVLTSSAASGNTWSTTATTNAITVNASGSYTVTETDVNSCQATSAATTVTVDPAPTAVGSVGTAAGNTITFANASVGATSYVWNFGDLSPTSTLTAPVYSYTANGTYTVTLIASNGTCTDTTTFTVTITTTGIDGLGLISGMLVYPNPLTSDSHLELNLTESTEVNVFVYDVTGKVVANVYNGELPAGINKLKLDISNLEAGIYYTTIVSKDSNKTLKMIIIK